VKNGYGKDILQIIRDAKGITTKTRNLCGSHQKVKIIFTFSYLFSNLFPSRYSMNH
jgi:hypothetical protein